MCTTLQQQPLHHPKPPNKLFIVETFQTITVLFTTFVGTMDSASTTTNETIKCTQEEDDIIEAVSTTPVASIDVSITATLKQFSSYPDDIKAKFVCAAAELEQSDDTPMYHSPRRRTLMGELEHIDVLATLLKKPALKTQLGEIAAGQYITSKQTTVTKPTQPRNLFKEPNDIVSEKEQSQIEVDQDDSSKQVYMGIKTKKKTYSIRKAKNIQWKKVDKLIINTITNKSMLKNICLITYELTSLHS